MENKLGWSRATLEFSFGPLNLDNPIVWYGMVWLFHRDISPHAKLCKI